MLKFSNLLPHCVGCLSGGGEVFFIIALDMPFVTWHGICFLLIENERIEDYAKLLGIIHRHHGCELAGVQPLEK